MLTSVFRNDGDGHRKMISPCQLSWASWNIYNDVNEDGCMLRYRDDDKFHL